jgi:hypothetical protein
MIIFSYERRSILYTRSQVCESKYESELGAAEDTIELIEAVVCL